MATLAVTMLAVLALGIVSIGYVFATARQQEIDWQVFFVVVALILTALGLMATAAMPFLM
jgi:hypothetical protein